MGRKPLPAAARKRQLNVALDKDTRQHLELSAKDSQRSVADEIRQRIERTLLQDALVRLVADKREQDIESLIRLCLERMVREEERYGEATRELGWDVMEFAHEVRFSNNVGWLDHSRVHAALVEAINTWLNALKPSPEDDDKEITEMMEKTDYNPQALGRTIAQLRIRNTGIAFPAYRQGRLTYYKMRDEDKRGPKKR
jgi:hypothetical protein